MDISSTYFHVMSISRMQSVKDSKGITRQTLAPVPLLQLISCAFSQASRNSANTAQSESINNITYNPKIFCAPMLDVKAGDRITVNYETKVIGEFSASEPYIYLTHQEIPLFKDSEA